MRSLSARDSNLSHSERGAENHPWSGPFNVLGCGQISALIGSESKFACANLVFRLM
jgi:hypothetical protein